MEPGPLPPHERTWRHPSELGPTSSDVDAATSSFGPHTRMLAAASSVLALMLVAAIVVTATPDRGDAPTALSATTTPVVAFSASTLRPAETPRYTIAPTQALLLVSLTAIPNEIASAPQLSLQLPAIADRLPESSEAVMVQTADVTYHCTWADVALLEMPDGTMVVDDHGDLVAQVDGGEVVALVEESTPTSSAPDTPATSDTPTASDTPATSDASTASDTPATSNASNASNASTASDTPASSDPSGASTTSIAD